MTRVRVEEVRGTCETFMIGEYMRFTHSIVLMILTVAQKHWIPFNQEIKVASICIARAGTGSIRHANEGGRKAERNAKCQVSKVQA
jgi:hypothetical protein